LIESLKVGSLFVGTKILFDIVRKLLMELLGEVGSNEVLVPFKVRNHRTQLIELLDRHIVQKPFVRNDDV